MTMRMPLKASILGIAVAAAMLVAGTAFATSNGATTTPGWGNGDENHVHAGPPGDSGHPCNPTHTDPKCCTAGKKCCKNDGIPGHKCCKNDGTPGHKCCKNDGTPGHQCCKHDDGTPKHCCKDDGTPGHDKQCKTGGDDGTAGGQGGDEGNDE